MKKNSLFLIFLVFSLAWSSCHNKSLHEKKSFSNTPEDTFKGDPLFHLLKPATSGIRFVNQIKEDDHLNFYNFQYMYNGGGVAIGDINNDGLPDIYFTGNMVNDRLYLNKGNMKFEDITLKAGIHDEKGWKNGVSMNDFNNDGRLDIYVCKGGWSKNPQDRMNLLYINNGDLTFTEHAMDYGLADAGFSVQAVYLDYDYDGDIDVYVSNHPDFYQGTLTQRLELMKNPNYLDSDHLYKNNGDGTFTDASLQAGIHEFGHGLGPTVIDANQDGWDDLFVANDFQTPDYLFVNNQDGTFTDHMKDYLKHCTYFSMGTDVADLNNDGYLDIICVEMLPEDYTREVENLAEMNESRKQIYFDDGLYYQYMRNALYLNNGNNTFSDIAQYSGVDATDWSWTPLLADFDQDGQVDLYITNGYLHDTQNRDWIVHAEKVAKEKYGNGLPLKEFLEKCPSNRILNYAYRGVGDVRFDKYTKRWGFDQATFSNGAAWGDLDNDGDLDLVVNNLMDTSMVYENTAEQNKSGNYFNLSFKGPTQNTLGIGTRVAVYSGDRRQFQVLYPVRGFESSSEPILHFGLGKANTIDKVEITWYDGRQQVITNPAVNQKLVVSYDDSKKGLFDTYPKAVQKTYFTEFKNSEIDFVHHEKPFDDYVKNLFLPQKFSLDGPCLAVADVNDDGLKDFYVGGASGQSAVLFMQSADAHFYHASNEVWQSDSLQQDVKAIFFDADNDGDADLYVANGSNRFGNQYDLLQDRLYLNDGKGKFHLAEDALPSMEVMKGCVDTCDYDHDGDEDLFVGGRMIPDKYGEAPRSYLLQNDHGKFTDVTQQIAHDLVSPGMVTGAAWSDIDGDGWKDLILVGELMNIAVYKNENGKLKKLDVASLTKTSGFWNTIVAGDFDGDGDEDFIAGNIGLNYKYTIASDTPMKVFMIDFDRNGIAEPYFARLVNGQYVPLRQVDVFDKKFTNFIARYGSYEKYAGMNVEEIFGKASKVFDVQQMASTFIRNDGHDKFTLTPLPWMAQLSSVNAIVVHDFDQDGFLDALLAGNTLDSPYDIGDADAGTGLLLKGNGKGSFQSISVSQSGFYTPGMVRDMAMLPLGKGAEGYYILVGNNNNRLQVFKTQ